MVKYDVVSAHSREESLECFSVKDALRLFSDRMSAAVNISVDPRQYIMSTTEELLARLVNLENEAVHARQRQGSAEQALAAAQQRIQQLSSGGSAPTPSTGVIIHGSDIGMDNVAIHVQGVCVCDASKNERFVRLGETERLGPCGQR